MYTNFYLHQNILGSFMTTENYDGVRKVADMAITSRA